MENKRIEITNKLVNTKLNIFFIPFWKYNTTFNTKIFSNNLITYEIYRKSTHFIDPNLILRNEHFTRHGLHLNRSGKIKLVVELRDILNGMETFVKLKIMWPVSFFVNNPMTSRNHSYLNQQQASVYLNAINCITNS